MSWYVGGEDAHYGDAPGPCPCAEAGLLECYCGGDVTADDGRDWLASRGEDVEAMHAVDVIARIEEIHPDGFEGFYDETAAPKIMRRIRARAA